MNVKTKLFARNGMLIQSAIALAFVGSSTTVFAYQGEELASQAKVTIKQAKAIALRARPGKIMDSELEKESGGTGLRYSFDIKRGPKTYEVGVDANDGKILENKVEGPNPD